MRKSSNTHGIPILITCDNGPQFKSFEFKEYLRVSDITLHNVTPLWLPANGEVERQNRTLLKRMKIAQAEGKNWRSEIYSFLLMYRSTPHSTTGMSPAELLFNRKLRTKLPQLEMYCDYDFGVQKRRDNDAEMTEKRKMYADVKRNAVNNRSSVETKRK